MTDSLRLYANARFSRRSERSEPRSAATGSSADASTDFRPDDPRQIFLAGPSGIPVCRRKASTAPAVGLVRRGRDHSSRSEGAHAVAAGEAGSPASPDDDLKSSPPCRPRYVHKGLTYILGLRLPAKARRRGFARNADYRRTPSRRTRRHTEGRGRFRSVARLAARASSRPPTRGLWPPPAPFRGTHRGAGRKADCT